MLLDSAGSPRSYGAPDVDDVLGFALSAKVRRRLSRLGLLVEPSVSEGICRRQRPTSRKNDAPFLLRFWMVAPDI